MLRGMVSSLVSKIVGGDETLAAGLRNDPKWIQAIADPTLVVAMEKLFLDPSMLDQFDYDNQVLDLLDSLAELGGGSAYSLRSRRLDLLEASQAARAASEAAEEELEVLADEDDGQRQEREAEARRKFAEIQRLRAERARAELAARAVPLEFDVKGWATQPWYERSGSMIRLLGEKGFCILKGNLPGSDLDMCIVEAKGLREASGFTRPPREVLSGLFGEIGSAWTCELSDPNKPTPQREKALRACDEVLEILGSEISGLSQQFFGMEIQGRTVGLAHLSRTADDKANPPLVDGDEADGYIMLFMRKKLKMIYYVGPCNAMMRIAPIDNEMSAFKTTLEAGTIVVVRGDVCRCTIDPISSSSPGLTVEVDFLAKEKQGPQEALRDRVRPPEELIAWYLQRLEALVSHDVENAPEDWHRLARNTFFNEGTKPVAIHQIATSWPSKAHEDEGDMSVATSTLFGFDVITEIPSTKWDMDVYYDEDPLNGDGFKMYTRHMGVTTISPLDCCVDFGLTTEEASQAGQRYLQLAETSITVLRTADLSKSFTQKHDMGLFVGLAGNELQYQILTKEAKLSKTSYLHSNNAMSVNRLTYILGSTGPCMCVDTEDASGSAALDTCLQYLRMGRCRFGLTSSASFIEHPLTLIMHCAAGTISWSGRSRTFDESADGVVRSEGAAALLLRLKLTSGADDKDLPPLPYRGAIMGSALNAKGVSASLTAPSGPAIQDVVRKALRDASYPVYLIEAVELNACGLSLGDTMELGVIEQAFLSKGSHPVVLRSNKSAVGETGALSGLASIARAVYLHKEAVHGPSLHLREFSEVSDGVHHKDTEGDRATKFVLTIELLEACKSQQHTCINSFSTTGTNVHHVLWGEKPEHRRQAYAGKPITWFPVCGEGAREPSEAGSEEREFMEAEYHIVGSWNAFREPLKMQQESPGMWSFVFKLGENRFESFQILMNGDKDKVLHPVNHWATGNDLGLSGVMGPSENCGRLQCWVVYAKAEKVCFINESQLQQFRTQEQEQQSSSFPADMRPMVVFGGDYKPPGFEHVENVWDMPTSIRNTEMIGMPGDPYKVRLQISGGGKYKKVDWFKLPASFPPRLAQDFGDHAYHITGDFNSWAFDRMQAVGDGVHEVRVQLNTEKSEFQICRDSDWDQVFFPEKGHDQDAKVIGPSFAGLGVCWLLEGEPGDVFLVRFTRKLSSSMWDDMSISWMLQGNEELPEEASDYFLIGSWNEFNDMEPMQRSKDGTFYTCDLTIGETCCEGFQILVDGNWSAVVHPNQRSASFRDEGHQLQGPDGKGALYMWSIGKDEEDNCRPGDVFRVKMELQQRRPFSVSWTKVASESDDRAADRPRERGNEEAKEVPTDQREATEDASDLHLQLQLQERPEATEDASDLQLQLQLQERPEATEDASDLQLQLQLQERPEDHGDEMGEEAEVAPTEDEAVLAIADQGGGAGFEEVT